MDFQQPDRRFTLACCLLFAAITNLPAIATAQSAQQTDRQIVLPGASSAEGIAAGEGSTFYAGDLFGGDIYRGDVRQGTAELFIDAPAGRQAAGMKFDDSTGLLFVAGGLTGQAYVYDTTNGTPVRTYFLASPGTLINDVTITSEGAWFTNSLAPELYFVPMGRGGVLGDAVTLTVTGPAAVLAGFPNLNGIATPDNGETLLVSHTSTHKIFIVDPETGASTDLGAEVHDPDGLLLEAGRLFVAQPGQQSIAVFKFSNRLKSVTPEETISSPLFHEPATVARFGNLLAAVNSHFGTGIPPTATQYEVVIVRR